MDGPVILVRLAALDRSRITQAAPTRNLDGGDRRIRRYGRTNGRTFDLPRDSVGGRVIEVSGQRGGEISSRARHFPILTPAEYHALRPVRFIAGVQLFPSILPKHPSHIRCRNFGLPQLFASHQFDQ